MCHSLKNGYDCHKIKTRKTYWKVNACGRYNGRRRFLTHPLVNPFPFWNTPLSHFTHPTGATLADVLRWFRSRKRFKTYQRQTVSKS